MILKNHEDAVGHIRTIRQGRTRDRGIERWRPPYRDFRAHGSARPHCCRLYRIHPRALSTGLPRRRTAAGDLAHLGDPRCSVHRRSASTLPTLLKCVHGKWWVAVVGRGNSFSTNVRTRMAPTAICRFCLGLRGRVHLQGEHGSLLDRCGCRTKSDRSFASDAADDSCCSGSGGRGHRSGIRAHCWTRASRNGSDLAAYRSNC